MNPTIRYELRAGEWRRDPPRVGYGCDRSRLVALLMAEHHAQAWTTGMSDAGPDITVAGHSLGCPPSVADLARLESLAEPAPYGRGEATIVDPAVRDALQIGAEHLALGGAGWERLEREMLEAVAAGMGLDDAELRLTPLKMLVYHAGGHFADHADTEKTPGMIASASVVVPGAYEGGALVVEHAGERLDFARGAAPRWRWAAWYADCRHRLEPVESGVRIAITFGVSIDPEAPLGKRRASNRRLGWAIWGRSYAEWHTEWAAREGRTEAGIEQYGQKTVWVLAHRYTEPGLRAGLLKGSDRTLARVLLGDPHSEARYLGWLQIRDVGTARTESGRGWNADTDGYDWLDDVKYDRDPLPASMLATDPVDLDESDPIEFDEHDPAPWRIAHRETPELHLEDVSRHNAWIEGLRTLGGEAADHGPIEVLDGEIVPPGALDDATPVGARVYEATGNEGASLELQYRHAVLVMWRGNGATLRMLARCGGRLALAVELTGRTTRTRGECSYAQEIESVLALWAEALATDGGAPEPRAHRLVLEAVNAEQDLWGDERLRDHYVKRVAAVDLDEAAVPTLIGWIDERLEAGKPTDAWVRALRAAYAQECPCRATSGAPALLRALVERPHTQALASAIAGMGDDPPATPEAVLGYADELDRWLEAHAWRRRRAARMTMDYPAPGEGAER